MAKPKLILVTGASSGIGWDAALYLASKGHRVLGTGRNADALEKLTIEANSEDLEVCTLDVTNTVSIHECKKKVDELTDGVGLYGLVNNAGFNVPGTMYDLPIERLRAQFETNVFGLMEVTQAFLPAMVKNQIGRVVNISSLAGRHSAPLLGAYHASKYAVEALSDALRMEVAAFGIKVVLIEPGPIKTDIPNRSLRELDYLDIENSPFKGVYEVAEKKVRKFTQQAVSPRHTSLAIEQALFAELPKARYVVPQRWELFLNLYRIMPTSWMDSIMRRAMFLTEKSLTRRIEPEKNG